MEDGEFIQDAEVMNQMVKVKKVVLLINLHIFHQTMNRGVTIDSHVFAVGEEEISNCKDNIFAVGSFSAVFRC